MILFCTSLLLILISFVLTGLLRGHALRHQVLDIPNSRSAHTTPTPRGGGLAFVICFLTTLVVLFGIQQIDKTQFLAIFLSSFIVAALGFWDDRCQLSAQGRLVGHFIAAGIIVYCFSPGDLWIAAHGKGALILANLGVVIYLVWFINLFNFMDGVDGLAAIETITVCFGGALLYALEGQFQALVLPLLLAASVIGFLLLNFPPARIFMGDVGSGFLGLLIGTFSLMAGEKNIALFYGWFILYGVFFCDASITLLRRLWRHENIFKAHCGHAYQHAARRYNSHQLVSLVIGGINCCWLLPIAVMVQQQVMTGIMGVMLAFAPLIVLVLKFGSER